ncbi:MAG: hypothetical protein GX811_08485 [Lentisphaerae bacterium]|jgi:hypothetical protein|nr:hypothetical protein [Lentisphaerota bacterium]
MKKDVVMSGAKRERVTPIEPRKTNIFLTMEYSENTEERLTHKAKYHGCKSAVARQGGNE